MPHSVRLVARVVFGALPFLLSAGTLVASGTLLSACDTAGCEGGALQVEDVVVGNGEEATATSTVTVTYVGTLEDGTVFDATDDDPATFDLAGTIEGFREGIAGMRVGGERRITIPPELAYDEEGIAGTVPPCATLIFNVTLLDVQ